MKKSDTNLSNQGMSTRERGKKFLDELKAKGPKLDRVGQSFIMKSTNPLQGNQSSKG